MLLKKNKDPCKQCLVKPMCKKGCERKYHFIRTRLTRTKTLQRYLPLITFLLNMLSYVGLARSDVGNGQLAISMIIIIAFSCATGLFVDLRYFDRRIFNLNEILFSIEMDIRIEQLSMY